MKGAAPTFEDAAPLAVVVVGEAREIDAIVPIGTLVARIGDGYASVDARPILVVFDARSYPLSALAEARRSPRFAQLPALLLAAADDDPALAQVGADDVLALPFPPTANGRVRTLVDLGRLRNAIRRNNDAGSLAEAHAEVARLAALQGRRQAFDHAILNGVDVGIITTDAGGRLTFANRSAHEILHRDDDVDGKDVREILALPAGPETLLASEVERHWVHSLRAGDCDIEIDLAITRARERAKEHLGFFYIFRDRTHEKRLEADRRRFERLAAMGTMVAGFAHEIRNPMASLRSIAEALNEELAEAGVKLPHVDRMLKVLERVESLVRTSLLFGRPSPPRPAAHKPWTILATAVSALSPRTTALGGELSMDVAPDLPDVYIDDGQLIQALVILLNNAIDATGSPRRVHLRAQCVRGVPDNGDAESALRPLVRFDVSDDGPGIPQEIIGRIFDPFFTTKASGTGLGLSIAQQLVTENAARLEVSSSLGGPTTFSVIVPRATESAMSRRVPRNFGPHSPLTSGK